MNKYKKIFLDGVIFSNPTFVLVLGTCPTLGLISSAMSAMSMGLCIIVILTLSNVLISAMRKVIPNEVRIPCYIVLIATLVTLLRMVLEKFLPDIYSALGGFLALIVVNCSAGSSHSSSSTASFWGARRRLPTNTPCPKPPWTALQTASGLP